MLKVDGFKMDMEATFWVEVLGAAVTYIGHHNILGLVDLGLHPGDLVGVPHRPVPAPASSHTTRPSSAAAAGGAARPLHLTGIVRVR